MTKKTEQNASRGAWQDPEGNTVPQERTDGGMRLSSLVKYVWIGNTNRNVLNLVGRITKLTPDLGECRFRTAPGAYEAIRTGKAYSLSISDDKTITATPGKA